MNSAVSRTYYIPRERCFAMAVGCLIFGALGLWFGWHGFPVEEAANSPWLYRGTSLLMAFFCLPGAVFFGKSFAWPKPALIVDERGVYDNATLVGIGRVPGSAMGSGLANTHFVLVFWSG
jgi:hypothetical protein